ncbi:MAG: NADP-dependent oxidoreductase [Solirubrobacterales bacterium]|nr:NADP-dependent oxidoreductase [Solirubrobacterales bacterium]
MPKAVRFDGYGDVDVLEVVDVEEPAPQAGETLVRVKAAGINPGEAKIRDGSLHEMFPATFPSGQGSDLAGVVERDGSGFRAGDEVVGWVDTRSSHAELVAVPAAQLIPKPANLSWEVAGGLFVAGTTAYAAVAAVGAAQGATVVVAGAAGGVGSLAVQLARRAGATVIGLASEHNHDWLSRFGVIPVSYGAGVAERIRRAAGEGDVDALIDTHGSGYVELALELGVARDRIDTIADFPAAQRYGVKTDGNGAGATPENMRHLVDLLASGELVLEVARTYPLDDVRAAYRELETGHTRGKIVLIP